MRIRSALALLALLGMPLAASADFVALKAGAYAWHADPSGWVQDEDVPGQAGRADLEDALNLDSERGYALWVAVEHPLPLLPNLKLQYTPLTLEGSGTIGRGFSFDGIDFPGGSAVDAELELNQTDVIFYWEALDNVIDLDLGINIKVLDGNVRATGAAGTAEDDFTIPLPMLYLNAGINLPLTGLRVGVEGSGTGYSGNRVVDVRASISYTVAKILNLEGGWRMQQIKLDDISDISTDIEVSGPFVGAYLHF